MVSEQEYYGCLVTVITEVLVVWVYRLKLLYLLDYETKTANAGITAKHKVIRK